ncbi:MAG TPA: cupin domain-containing protein [Actinocatenispora sp.]
MPVLTFADSPTIDAHGLTARPMAVPSRGSTELALWYLTLPAGNDGPTHSVSHEEIFVVQTGRLAGHLDGQPVTLGPGDVLAVPPGVPFGVGNPGTTPATVLVCTSAGVTATLDGQTIHPVWSR